MFIPGEIIKKIKTKKGREAVIRYPKWEDLDQLTRYINNLSKENTFITFSGEEILKQDEAKVLSKWFIDMDFGDKIVLCSFINNKLVGVANIDRNKENRRRSLHVGVFGISVAKNYRREGIGFQLAKTIIEEAKNKLKPLKIIILDVYSLNKKAINLYKKLGFIEYGCLKKGIYYKNNFIDEIKMALYL